MKRYLTTLLLSLSVIAMIPEMTGCALIKGTSTNRAVYTTLYAAGSGVNSGYAAYLDRVVRNEATYNVAVAKAYNQFQATFNVAVEAASSNLNALAPQDVVNLANAFYAAVKAFK